MEGRTLLFSEILHPYFPVSTRVYYKLKLRTRSNPAKRLQG